MRVQWRGKGCYFNIIIQSILQIWADAVELQVNTRKMQKDYRLTALRVISAFRTVSDKAACVLAGMMPIYIVVDEACRLFESKQIECVSQEGHQGKAGNSDGTKRTRVVRHTGLYLVWTPGLNRKHGEVNNNTISYIPRELK